MGRNNHNSYTDEQIIDFEEIKKMLCENMSIARKLADMTTEESAPSLAIEASSLRKIEAQNVDVGPSLEVLCGAIALYGQKPDFYWELPEENQKLLDDKQKGTD